MDCVQWCLCPAKWKSTEKEVTGKMGESFMCKKSPYVTLVLPLCGGKNPTLLKTSSDMREGKPDLLSCPCREVAKPSLNCWGQTAVWAG